MIQRGEQACFPVEAREALPIGGECRRQHLDRDVASQLRVARAIDFAHPARAKSREDLIRPDGDR